MPLYSIKVHNYCKESFLACQSRDGSCRQDYTNKDDSKWELIRCNPYRKDSYYYIRGKNITNNKQHNNWLSFNVNAKQKWVGIYPNKHNKSVWKLVADGKDARICRIACFHDGCFRGWIGVSNNQQKNKLVDDINEAVIFAFNRINA
eukprot:327861_1